MRFLALIPQLVFGVVTLRLGLGLLWRSRHTGAWPERCLGLAVVFSALALPLFAFSRVPGVFGTPKGNWLAVVGSIVLGTGVMFLYAFTWVVFRQREGLAVLLVAVGSSLAYGAGLGMAVAGWDARTMVEALPQMRPYTIALLVSIATAFGWSSVESFLCWLRHRRQLRIGLADPVVVNRFLLWTCAGGSIAWLSAILIGLLMSGVVIVRDQLGMSCIGIGGSMAAASWWLTFFPPRWYIRAIRRGAAR